MAISANAASYYVGTIKSSSQKGISAYITPKKFPNVSGSGESCWVSNVYTNTNGTYWVQAGLRYYDNSDYDGLKTYVEVKLPSGGYNIVEYGYHVLDYAGQYKVEYQSDGKWHAYLGPYDKGSFSLGVSSAPVEACAEAHSTTIELGPFAFSSVQYKNTSGTWKYMDETPFAESPFHVDVTNNYTYTAY